MDEIDAALDFRNVSIVANYIKDRTKNAQFIIISLRNDMFELSHRLIGIYKTSNQTRSKFSRNEEAISDIATANTTATSTTKARRPSRCETEESQRYRRDITRNQALAPFAYTPWRRAGGDGGGISSSVTSADSAPFVAPH